MKTARVRFDALAAGGNAVGRDETGRAVFAPRAAPGDVAVVSLAREKKTFAQGEITQLENPSLLRTQPPCPFFDSGEIATSCGGCTWQHLIYEAQLRAKTRIVRDALQRIGGIENADALIRDCIPSPRQFHYRNKADFVIAPQGSGTAVGFFAPESHRIVDVDHCLIQQEPNNAILSAVREALSLRLAEPFDATTGKGVLRRLVTRVSSSGETLACVVTARDSWPQEREFATFLREREPSLVGVLHRAPDSDAKLIDDGRGDARDWLEEEVADRKLRVSGDGFFQINTSLVAALCETALGMMNVGPGESVLDLFCGVGLFSLGLAAADARVTGIELSRGAIHDARGNAQRNDLEARFIAGYANRELRRLRLSGNERFDCVLLDPPRAGAAGALDEIAAFNPRRIVYVSCDPATLSRDIKTLSGRGYRLVEAVPLDLFPQTAHVETVARLDRRR